MTSSCQSCDTPSRTAVADALGVQLVRLRKSSEAVRARVLGASGHGLEGSGLAVLHHLMSAGELRVTVLAELLGLDPSTMSRHVAALERSGHVERVPDPADRRAGLVRATAKGATAYDDTRALRNRVLAHALQDWEEAEVTALAATLARFNDAVETLAEVSLHDLAPPADDAATDGPGRTTTPRAGR